MLRAGPAPFWVAAAKMGILEALKCKEWLWGLVEFTISGRTVRESRHHDSYGLLLRCREI